jgi:hypothetical protein
MNERVAYHESGHVAAALNFGLPVISLTIEDDPRLLRGYFRQHRNLAVRESGNLVFERTVRRGTVLRSGQ